MIFIIRESTWPCCLREETFPWHYIPKGFLHKSPRHLRPCTSNFLHRAKWGLPSHSDPPAGPSVWSLSSWPWRKEATVGNKPWQSTSFDMEQTWVRIPIPSLCHCVTWWTHLPSRSLSFLLGNMERVPSSGVIVGAEWAHSVWHSARSLAQSRCFINWVSFLPLPFPRMQPGVFFLWVGGWVGV